ncbi:hypothetical protein [Phenylobacterium immobile]|uniref:hypothetical protein n=1 Tax=Phenylobacterium immobile TaxID=21 RepID=UPI000AF10AD5|nr:hypothetical protein [Phenylobacterium immobile]
MEDRGLKAIEIAIEHAARAGRLRSYVMKNGEGLAGLLRLADSESSLARLALGDATRLTASH